MKRFTVLLLLIIPFFVKATGYVSVTSGNWSNATTWSPAGHPGSGDDVTINTAVTLDVNASIHNITINVSQSLADYSSYSLTVYGNFIDNGGWYPFNSTVTFSGSSNQHLTFTPISGGDFYNLTINQSASTDTVFLDTPIPVNNNLTLTTGVLACQTNQITGNVVGSGSLSMASGTSLVLGLASSATNVSFPTGYTSSIGNSHLNSNSTIVYLANTASQKISSVQNYGNLAIYTGASSISKSLSAAGTLNVAGNLTVGDGVSSGVVTLPMGSSSISLTGAAATATINTNGAITFTTGSIAVTNNVLINGNGSLSYSGLGYLTIGGNFTNNGASPSTSFIAGTSLVTFNGTSNQTLGGTQNTTFYDVLVNQSSNTDTLKLGDSVTVVDKLELQTGKLDQSKAGNYSVLVKANFENIESATAMVPEKGTIYFGKGGGSITLNNSTFASTFYNVVCNPGAGNSVTASGNNMTVNYNLLDSTGNFIVNTKTVTVGNNVTVSSGTTLTYTTGTLNVGGSFIDNGTFTYGTSIVNFNGSGSIIQSIKGTAAQPLNFYDLTVAATAPDTIRLGDSIVVNDNFTLTSGVFDVSKNDYELICKNNSFTNNAASSAFVARKGTVIFNGAYFLNGTSSTIFNDVKIESHYIIINTNETIQDTLTFIAGGSIQMNSPQILSIGNAFLNYTAGGFTALTGLFQFTGNTNTLNYIGGTQAISIPNFKVNLAHATDTLFLDNEGITISNHDTIKQGVLNCQNYTLTGGGSTLYMGSTSTLVLGLRSSATNSPFPVYTSYNIDPASTVIYQAATASQQISATPNYGNLDIYTGGAGAITKTFSPAGTLTVKSNLIIGNAIAAGVVTLNSAANAINVTGNALINTDGKLLGSTGAYEFDGNLTNNGVLTATANTTTFGNASTLQTVGGSSASTFNNVVINGYDVIITHNENASGTFVINGSKTFDCGASRQIMTVTGAFTNNGTFTGDNGILQVAGNFANNSTFTPNTSMVTFNGSGAQTVGGTTSCQFYDFTVNCSALANTVTLNTAESFTDSASIQVGTLAASPASVEMTLISNAAGTARIGKVANAANVSITAKFNVQRYESSRGTTANYACLSAPVATTLGDWNSSNQTFPNVMYMSGVGGPNGTGANNFVSVKKVDETKSSTNSACYVPITTYTTPGINYVIQPGDGIYMWLGENMTQMWDPYTYVQNGTPTFGSVTYITPIGVDAGGLNGFNVIGNPYASPISWSKFQSQNLGLNLWPQYYIVENTGAWVGTASDAIPMCQGFGIAARAAGSAVFTENQKISGNPLLDSPVLPTGIASNNNCVTFRLTDDVNPFSTPVTFKFGTGYTKNSNMYGDALYIPSMTEGIPVLYTTSADQVKMEYKTLPDSEWVQEVPLTAFAQVAGKHTLKMETPVTDYDCVNLIEKSTGRVLNNFNANQTYSFTMQLGQQEDFILQFGKLSPGQICQSIDNITTVDLLPSNINVLPDQYGAVVRFNLPKPSDAVISVYSILGEKVISDISTNAYDNSVHVDLAAGQIYIIKIQTAGGMVVKKLFH
jgi:hypothetical protein